MFPDFKTFASVHTTQMQLDAVKNPFRYLTGINPTFREVEFMYSERALVNWIRMQLINVISTQKMDEEYETLLQKMIQKLIAVFYNNTCKEFVLFLGELDCGKLGKIYGSFNVQDVLEAASVFHKGLFKRKQDASHQYQQDNGMLNVKSDLNDKDVPVGAKALADYLRTAPANSYLAYVSEKFKLGYELSPESKATVGSVADRMKNLFKPCYLIE